MQKLITPAQALCALLALIISSVAMGQYSYVTAPTNVIGSPIGISGDGSTVLYPFGFWIPSRGPVTWNGPNNTFEDEITGISDNGFYFSAYAEFSFLHRLDTYIWDANGDVSPAGSPPDNPTGNIFSYGISGDASTLLTEDWNSSNGIYSSRIYRNGTYTTIVTGLDQNFPGACSLDGSIVAGRGLTSGGFAYAWVGGPSLAWYYFYGSYGVSIQVTHVNSAGTLVWGYIGNNSNGAVTGFRYQVGGAIQYITNFIPSTATDDGYITAGTNTTNQNAALSFGASSSLVDYQGFLASQGFSLPASQLTHPYISKDGKHVITDQDGDGQVAFYITEPGFAVVANNSTYNMTEGQTLSEPAATGALAPTANLYEGTAVLESNPSYAASFTLNSDGSFTYQPLPGFYGTDSFTFAVHRDLVTSNTATVFINVAQAPVKICVKERLGLGTVPDGTVVKILNNDGTALSPAQSETTVSGVATFPPLPAPTAPNASYEVEVCVPSGGVGVPIIQHGATGTNETLYLTLVRPLVQQTLSAVSPVAYASVVFTGVRSYTGIDGQSAAYWLPDGTYTGTATMSPGLPAAFSATLGATSAGVTAVSGIARLCTHLTRTTLTARTSTGSTYIPKTGTWSLTPGTLSEAVNGQVTSGAWWLPNGAYTATLSGATMNGSGSFTLGSPIADNWQVVVVVSGPKKP